MSNKAPVIIAKEPATKLNSDKVLKSGKKAKAFYQYFTPYFLSILLICTITSSMTLLFVYQQSKQSQLLINEHFAPLQIQFQQQSHLINANYFIDDILQNPDIHQLTFLQQKLLRQSKKLSLIQSQYHSTYQQLFINNNAATELVTRIKSSHVSNELLKSKGLIQLDTLLDAIVIQLNKSEVDATVVQLLITVKNNLSNVFTRFQRFNLQTSLDEFDQLQAIIDEMFVADYGKMLASQRGDSQAMTEIVKDFIRFEDMVLKRGLLTKWQEHLRLIASYQHQLMADKKQLKSILRSLSDGEKSKTGTFNHVPIELKKAIAQSQLPKWLWASFILSLVSIGILLWFIRQRIKVYSQHNLDYIDEALIGGSTSFNSKGKARLIEDNEANVYCAETYLLVEKIQQLNDSRVCEGDYLALVEKNQALEAQTIKAQAKQEQHQIEHVASEKAKLSTQQSRCDELHLAAINQLVLLGCSAVTTSINAKGSHKACVKENYLYHAYMQGCDLAQQLKQASFKNYFRSSDAVLTLSDENLIAQMQGVLLNLANEFSAGQNQVSLDIDEKIQAAVNLDVELFIEMFRAFVKLLLSQQTPYKLLLSLQLVDKNNGQQTICFTGQVQGDETLEQLPPKLESFNVVINKQSEPTEYFTRLLQYQHGENISATLIENGYQLSFTIPFAVTNAKQEQRYPTMTFPAHLSTIDQAITKLTVKYVTMPVDVLLAVKSPVQYQRLQQLLQGLGLQVSFVSSDIMLGNYWNSGRFAVLITELSCAPFIHFMKNEQGIIQESADLPRGVFTLNSALSLKTKEEFSHWSFGQLSANSSIDDLITAMLPWIKEQANMTSVTEKPPQASSSNDIFSRAGQVEHTVLTPTKQAPSFNFDRYIKHQGSAELALYMLDEYTAENTALVAQLSQAFTANNVGNANIAIQALVVNGKILSADYLLHLCEHWQKLLSKQGIDNTQNIQIRLLDKTTKAVAAINQHADAVV